MCLEASNFPVKPQMKDFAGMIFVQNVWKFQSKLAWTKFLCEQFQNICRIVKPKVGPAIGGQGLEIGLALIPKTPEFESKTPTHPPLKLKIRPPRRDGVELEQSSTFV